MKKIHISNQYVKQGLTLFFAGLALILSWYALNNWTHLADLADKMNGILMPFYIGLVLAYLLSPIYNGIVTALYGELIGFIPKKTTAYRICRIVATVFTVGMFIAAVTGFCILIIPDLIESITGLIYKIPTTIDAISEWFMVNIQENPQLADVMQGYLADFSEDFAIIVQEKIQPLMETVVSGLTEGVWGTFSAVLDIFVALIICVYALNSKEMFQAQAKKLVLAVFKRERAEGIFELCQLSNKTFGGFINGKIIDSVIIGILCFIGMSLINLPLATLVSVIVGITNVIPFFGPFIGAIPSIILILIIDPIAAVKFALWVLILQQLDGNVIGPKILGDSTGLASFWVMFAIIVGGGLFGFVGMVLGVPVFAIFYTYVTRFVYRNLEEKGLETDTVVYEDLTKYDINKEDIFGKERCNSGTEPGIK